MVKHNLKAIVASVSGDTLAVHEILGFLSPSSKCFCRQCMITRDHLRNSSSIIDETTPLRSVVLHNEQISQLETNPQLSANFGLKEN